MRNLAFFLLLATAAAPAFAAQERDHGGRHHDSGDSDQSETPPQRPSESHAGDHPRRSVTVQQTQDNSGHQSGIERLREHYQQHQQTTSQQSSTTESSTIQSNLDETVQNGSVGDHQGTGAPETRSGWRQRERHVRTIPDTQATTTQSTSTESSGFHGRNHRDYRDGNYSRWSHNWRNDHRYDWTSWRHHHRSTFHLGFYYDPFGWNYRRWSIGSFLYPSFYGSNYWLGDPWQYRLPPAYGPYRWVRYWNDALLVNIYTGEVVDEIHSFFW